MGRPRIPSKDRQKGRGRMMYPEDWHQKTPETQAISLANLRQNQPKGGESTTKSAGRFNHKALQEANIIEFAEDWLGVSFEERPAQRVILKSLYGLRLNVTGKVDEVALYRLLTTNGVIFEEMVEKTEACWVVGARGGKSTLASIIALYEATRDKWREYLLKDEIAYVVIIATRLQQAEHLIGANCARLAMAKGSRVSHLIKESYQTSLLLSNNICIASFPCNSTAARGYPIVCLIFDEIAHYRSEGPKADIEIFNSLDPRQAQFPGAKCLKISTPTGKQGLLWTEFDEGFQVPGRLTIHAPTRLVNPVIPQAFIDKAYERDPDNADREFGAKFAETVSGFFETCIDALKNCFSEPNEDIPYQAGTKYYAGIDQSGLSVKGDRWGFCISHFDGRANKTVADVTRSWQTKNLDFILAEIAAFFQTYHIRELTIDRYAKGFVENAFGQKGISVVIRDTLAAVYTTFKTLVVAGKVALPDRKDLRDGLFLTQAFYGKSQNLSIGHERTSQGHGDLADAVVTSCWEASRGNIHGVQLTAEEEREANRRDEENRHYDRLRWGISVGASRHDRFRR